MLHLPASWVWDFWTAFDGKQHHLFFLKASRALHDPDRRHVHASIGHATSQDLVTWEECADALVPSDAPAWDDRATWTGSVVHDDRHDRWVMFYTGVSSQTAALDQRIGRAVSSDLVTWHKDSHLVLGPDPRWYETHEDPACVDEAWRDPFVFAGADGLWHMLVTARAAEGQRDERGVVGHAVSSTLDQWQVRPPLSAPGTGFGHMEVFQHCVVDGRGVLLFSCLRPELGAQRRPGGGGVWAINVDDPLQGVDPRAAYRVSGEELYVGKLVEDGDTWVFLAFMNDRPDGGWGGDIIDPRPVSWQGDRLVVPGVSA